MGMRFTGSQLDTVMSKLRIWTSFPRQGAQVQDSGVEVTQNDLTLKLLTQKHPEVTSDLGLPVISFLCTPLVSVMRGAVTEDMQWGGSCPSRASPLPQV